MARRRPTAKPPVGVALSLAARFNTWLDDFNGHVLAAVMKAWEQDHPQPRADANAPITSNRVTKVIGGLRIDLAERFDPGTQLSQDIRVLAVRVVKKNQLEFQRVVGIPTTDLGLGSLVAGFRTANIAKITSLAGTQLDEIETILDQGDLEAERVESIRAKIQDRFDVTKSKADLLARDQVLKLNGDITQVRQQNAGITRYTWRTSEDERVRPDHEALDDTVQSWAAPPVVDEKSGRRAHPGGDIQCRCTADPILPELDEGADQE